MQRRRLFTILVLSALAAGAFYVAVGTVLGLASFRDVNYPDSATLLRVKEFAGTGRLYPEINLPPYYVTLYGPLTYVFLGVPYSLAQIAGIDPQVLVRTLPAIASFVCLALIFFITEHLYGSRQIAWVSVLFAASISPLAIWTTQIRGDLPGISLALTSVYLTVSSLKHLTAKNSTTIRSGKFTWRTVASPMIGGAAVLVKQTFFAATAATVCWLLFRRRYREAVFRAIVFAFTVAGAYGFAGWREPLLAEHLAAIRHPVLEYAGTWRILSRGLMQPELPFLAIGAYVSIRKATSERLLIPIYCLIAWVITLLTVSQVGAGTNYLLEPLLVSAILAGPGFAELQQQIDRMALRRAVVVSVCVLLCFVPIAFYETDGFSGLYQEMLSFREDKRNWQAFVKYVAGRNLLSTIPDITIQAKVPMIPDPFLNSVLERAGTWKYDPVVARIHAKAFDIIITYEGEAEDPSGYRGIPSWNGAMWTEVRKAYKPACVFEGMEVWLPKQGDPSILPGLLRMGCTP